MGTATGTQTVPAQRKHVELPHTPVAPRIARRALRDTVKDWGLVLDLDAPLEVLSELVTNAVLHALSIIGADIIFEADRGHLHFEVSDLSPEIMPCVKEVDPEKFLEEGRGMFLVDALADQWGVRKGDKSKTVWVLFQF